MAISSKDSGKKASGGAAPAQQQQQPSAGQNNIWSFHQQDVLGNVGIAAGMGGEYFTKFRTVLGDILKEIATGVKVSMVLLNRQNFPTLRFSAIGIVTEMPEQDAGLVAFHTLILEATGDRLPKRNEQLDGMQVQVNVTTGDAYDEVMYMTMAQEVSKLYPNSRVINAEAEVVPSSINPERKEQMEQIARNVAMAGVSAIMNSSENQSPLNLAQMDKAAGFNINVSIGNHQAYDIFGLPMRSSVLIALDSVIRSGGDYNSNPDIVNTPDRAIPVARVSGFMQPIWAPMVQQNAFGFNNQQQQPTQKFVNELVVTGIETSFATSVSAVLLALCSTLSLVDSDSWIQAYIPRTNTGRSPERTTVDISDIGALNITANISNEEDKKGFGSPINLSSIQGEISKINSYLVSLFRPGTLISLDCPEVGAQSWYLQVFARAAGGDGDAYAMIWNAANDLFNGNFEKHFPYGTPMFSNAIRVPLGHYVGNDSMLQDIRNIDFVAVSNLFKSNPQVIFDYANSFINRPGFNARRLLTLRENIIRDALNQQCEITGYAARVTATDQLISALSICQMESNIPTTINTPMSADQLRVGTPAPSYINGSLVSNTRSFGYGAGGGQTRNTAYNPGRRYGG